MLPISTADKDVISLNLIYTLETEMASVLVILKDFCNNQYY